MNDNELAIHMIECMRLFCLESGSFGSGDRLHNAANRAKVALERENHRLLKLKRKNGNWTTCSVCEAKVLGTDIYCRKCGHALKQNIVKFEIEDIGGIINASTKNNDEQ